MHVRLARWLKLVLAAAAVSALVGALFLHATAQQKQAFQRDSPQTNAERETPPSWNATSTISSSAVELNADSGDGPGEGVTPGALHRRATDAHPRDDDAQPGSEQPGSAPFSNNDQPQPSRDVLLGDVSVRDVSLRDVSLRGDGDALRVMFVLAASDAYFCSLGLAIMSVQRHHPGARIVVYDLGLRPAQRQWLGRMPAAVELRPFAYERYPRHLNISVAAGQYAWKPVVIADAITDAKDDVDVVVWMDAGDALRAPLTPHWPAIWSAGGVYSGVSSGTVATWTHPRMLAAFGIAPDAPITRERNCDAAFLVLFPERAARALVEPWRECALKRACIAPRGSNRNNHRQDQAALTLLIRLQPERFRTCRPEGDDPIRATYGSHLDHIDNRPGGVGACGRRNLNASLAG